MSTTAYKVRPIKVDYVMEYIMPPQLSEGKLSIFCFLTYVAKMQTLIKATAGAKASMQVVVYCNLAVNIILASSLQFLWALVNALQLIVRVPLFTLDFPYNT